MLRMFLLQSWFHLSDEGIEDSIYDSYAFRKFMSLDFTKEQVPDATTLYKFRKLLVDNDIARLFFEAINRCLEQHIKLLDSPEVPSMSEYHLHQSTLIF